MQVDLGSVMAIARLIVRHAGAGGEDPALDTRDFNLQLSTDGSTFTTVVTATGNGSNVTSYDIAAATGRYVRLNVITPTSNGDPAARIYELEVYGPGSGGAGGGSGGAGGSAGAVGSGGAGGGGSGSTTNLALNKPATSTTPCASTEGPAKADNGTVNGGNGDKWCSKVALPSWRVDLGASTTIGRIVVKHAGAGGEDPALDTRDFNLQVSSDGSTFTTVAAVTGNTSDVTTHAITPRTARYVRLNVTTPTANGDIAARIYEVEVYSQ
jgi:hypothetical protein